MKIPNFDDKDLAIVGLVILGMTVTLIGWAMEADSAVLFTTISGLGTGIAGLATGRKKEIENKPAE